MWIGAQNGIAKFNGNDWTVYDEMNSPLQLIPDIYSMSFDTNNNLWFGHYYGLGRLNDTTWSFWDESPFYYLTSVKHHSDGTVWGTPEWGVPINLTSDSTWEVYSFLSIPDTWNNQFAIDTNGVIWFGKFDPNEKMIAYDGYNFNGLNIPFTEIQNSSVKSIYSDKNNNKWFGFYNGYVVKYTGDFPTYVENDNENVNLDFSLHQNYPNPFNPVTTIKYTIPALVVGNENFRSVQITIFDILFREIKTLVNEQKPAGTYEVQFDASQLSSGVYFYQLSAGSFIQTKELMLLK